jgi:signal transduction histidine kinase
MPPALALSIIDDGVGPPPDWQATPAHATGRQPTARGLGLSIVREVMARHGGSLSLQPRHPHGLVARLVFPRRAPVAAAGATSAQPAGAGAGEP